MTGTLIVKLTSTNGTLSTRVMTDNDDPQFLFGVLGLYTDYLVRKTGMSAEKVIMATMMCQQAAETTREEN